MSDELQDFSGVVPLFPLPNLVLFPHVVQPLHIFEPRYRDMTADALADNRLLAMVLLQPGWDHDYEGRPPIYSVACLGKIVADHLLADGRYNLLLRGLSRVVILEETPPDRLYRRARVHLLPDTQPPPFEQDQELRQLLGTAALAWMPAGQAVEQLQKLMLSNLPLGSSATCWPSPCRCPWKASRRCWSRRKSPSARNCCTACSNRRHRRRSRPTGRCGNIPRTSA